MDRNKGLILLLLGVIGVTLIVSPQSVHAFQSRSNEVTDTPTPSTEYELVNTPEVKITGLEGFEENTNPLTGLEVENPDNLNRRPVMIKVSNYPRFGRPHAGLSAADLVFEYYIGEEMNRFMAVYYGQNTDQVGPLRSGRLIDVQLASMFGSFLVYGGADSKVNTIILNHLHERTLTHLTSPCPPICGQDTHSIAGVFVDSGAVTDYFVNKQASNERQDLDGFLFTEEPQGFTSYAIQIGLEYSFRNRGEWRYDPETNTYLRWIEADDEYTMIPLVDRNTNEQLSFSNVIVIFAEYIEYAPTLHDVKLIEAKTGKAAIFRDAVMIDAFWKIEDAFHPIQFVDSFGQPVPLQFGNTWMIFVGLQTEVGKSSDGSWEYYFGYP